MTTESEARPNTVKLAVFDIDNTLREGYTLKDFATLLLQEDHFKESAYRGLEEIERLFKGIDYTKFAQGWVFHYAHGVKGQPVKKVEEIADEYARHHLNLFPFSRDLIQFVTEEGFVPVAISGSPYEPIKALCNSLGITEVFATRFLTQNGFFLADGIMTTYIADKSKKTAYEWACYNIKLRQNNFDLQIDHSHSLGFGDSEHDISFLEEVGYPVAVRPNPVLQAYVHQRNPRWKIVLPDGDVTQAIREYISGPPALTPSI